MSMVRVKQVMQVTVGVRVALPTLCSSCEYVSAYSASAYYVEFCPETPRTKTVLLVLDEADTIVAWVNAVSTVAARQVVR
jgi:hypothetical protein